MMGNALDMCDFISTTQEDKSHMLGGFTSP